MTPEALAVAVEDAVRALYTRAKLAGVADPDTFSREFVMALRHQGWRPFAAVTALPPRPNVVHLPPAELIEQTRAQLRAARPHTDTKEAGNA